MAPALLTSSSSSPPLLFCTPFLSCTSSAVLTSPSPLPLPAPPTSFSSSATHFAYTLPAVVASAAAASAAAASATASGATPAAAIAASPPLLNTHLSDGTLIASTPCPGGSRVLLFNATVVLILPQTKNPGVLTVADFSNHKQNEKQNEKAEISAKVLTFPRAVSSVSCVKARLWVLQFEEDSADLTSADGDESEAANTAIYQITADMKLKCLASLSSSCSATTNAHIVTAVTDSSNKNAVTLSLYSILSPTPSKPVFTAALPPHKSGGFERPLEIVALPSVGLPKGVVSLVLRTTLSTCALLLSETACLPIVALPHPARSKLSSTIIVPSSSSSSSPYTVTEVNATSKSTLVHSIDPLYPPYLAALLSDSYDEADSLVAAAGDLAPEGMSLADVSCRLLKSAIKHSSPSPSSSSASASASPSPLSDDDVREATRRLVSSYVTSSATTLPLLLSLRTAAIAHNSGFDVLSSVASKCAKSITHAHHTASLSAIIAECAEFTSTANILTSYNVAPSPSLRTRQDVQARLISHSAFFTAAAFRAMASITETDTVQEIPSSSCFRLVHLLSHIPDLLSNVPLIRKLCLTFAFARDAERDYASIVTFFDYVVSKISSASPPSLLRAKHKSARRVATGAESVTDLLAHLTTCVVKCREISVARSHGVSDATLKSYTSVEDLAVRMLAATPPPITSSSHIIDLLSASLSRTTLRDDNIAALHDAALSSYISSLVLHGDSHVDLAASLTPLLRTPDARLTVSLKILRAASALTPAIAALAAAALPYCTSTHARTSLSETLRLITINAIIHRYTGLSPAESQFRFSDPAAARKLLGHVATFVDVPEAPEDIDKITEAFRSVTTTDGYTDHIQRVALADGPGRADQVEALLVRVFENHGALAGDSVTTALLSFFESFLTSLSLAKRAAAGMVVVLSVAKSSSPATFQQSNHADLLQIVHRVQKLQRFASFVSVEDVRQENLHALLGDLPFPLSASSPSPASQRRKVEAMLGGRCECHSAYYDWAASQAALFLHHPDFSVPAFTLLLSDHLLLEDGYYEHKHLAVLSTVKLLIAQSSKEEDDSSSADPSLPLVTIAHHLMTKVGLQGCPPSAFSSVMQLYEQLNLSFLLLKRMGNGVGETVEELAASLPNNPSTSAASFTNTSTSTRHLALPSLRAALSPTHYTSDGLLLPPTAARLHITRYLSTANPSTETIASLVKFLSTAGAHSLALQFLTLPEDLEQKSELETLHTATLATLAERTLSDPHTIDFQLAFGYLTALPQKIAFNTYKNALPPAMAKKSYNLIHSLSQIGVAAGEHWGNQQEFTSQCRRLAHNSKWWGVLQKYSVPFEPRLFEDSEKTTEYVTSLVLPLITSASSELNADGALKLAQEFCEGFDISEAVAPQKQIERLLKQSSPSLLMDTNSLNKSLQLLPSTAARLSTLRRCVIELESSSKYATLYDLHSTALEYYRLELGELLRECCDDDEVVNSVRKDAPNERKKQSVRDEIERVDRRRDALAILVTFAAKQKTGTRLPNYNKLFLKFPTPFGSSGRGTVRRAGVLLNLNREAGLFDPLDCLREFLNSSGSDATLSDNLSSTVLIPLCHSLGLPGGYVPARMLQESFLRPDATPPPFEGSVKPVLVKLPAFDAGVLGAWCASKYLEAGRGGHFAKMRLKCLEESYRYSLEAGKSIEEEERGTRGGSIMEEDEEEEDDEDESTVRYGNNESDRMKQAKQALETSRRIGEDLSALKNELKMREILEGSAGADADTTRPAVNIGMSSIVDDIFRQLGEGGTDEEGEEVKVNASADVLVEKLMREGSRRAAAALEKGAFTVEDLRDAAWRVHSAAGALAEDHTEVNVERTCRRLARSLLEVGEGGSKKSAGGGGGGAGGRGGGDGEGEGGTKEDLFASTSSGGKSASAPPSSMDAIGEDEEDDEEEKEGGGGVDMSLDLKSLSNIKTVENFAEKVEEVARKSCILKRDPFSEDEFAAVQIAFLLSYSYSFFENGGCGGGDAASMDSSMDYSKSARNSSFSLNSSGDTSTGGLGFGGGGGGGGDSDPATKHSRNLLTAVFSIHSKKTGGTKNKGVLGERSDNVDVGENKEGGGGGGGGGGGRRGGGRGGKGREEGEGEGDENSSFFRNKSTTTAEKSGAPFIGNSFAAKFRALRAATILAPREALVKILPDFAACDLDKLAFASFCAKEMEAMKLAVPCATLAELSKMDLSNLARALWKDHALDVGKGEQAPAFHELLIKLIVENGISDFGLLKTIVENVAKQAKEFPRVLVTCCELLVEKIAGVLQGEPKIGRVLVSQLKGIIKEVGRLLGEEMARMKPQPQGFVSADFVSVRELKEAVDGFVLLVVRLGVVGGAATHSDWSAVGLRLLELVDHARSCYFDDRDKEGARRVLVEAAAMINCETKEKKGGTGRETVWEEIRKVEGGEQVLKELAGGGEGGGRRMRGAWDEGGFKEMIAEERMLVDEVLACLEEGGGGEAEES